MDDAFLWDLTLAEFSALRRQYESDVQTSLIGSAMVCAMLANIHGPKKRKQPFTIQDFLPAPDGKPSRRTRQSAQDMLRHVMGVQADLSQAKSEIAAARKRK